ILVKSSPEEVSLNWNYLAGFSSLSYLKIEYSLLLTNDLISYLQLDRLQFLSIESFCLQELNERAFFKCIFHLKKLKALRVSIQSTKGVILGDSIECVDLYFKGIKSSSKYSGSSYSEYLIREFSSFLPKGANVKYLTI